MCSKIVSSVFVSNNGLWDHIGQAQVIPYISGLVARGHRISTLTVEQSPDNVRGDLSIGPVDTHHVWRQTGYGRVVDKLSVGLRLARRLDTLVNSRKPDILHCRSYMPLSGAIRAARRYRLKLIFDMRGFWVDQRIEGGNWNPRSLPGRALIHRFRALEARGYSEADAIIVLTHDAKTIVEANSAYRGAPISVIPCSVDQRRFGVDPALRFEKRTELGIQDDTPVVAYLGSSSGIYRLDLLYRFYDAVRGRSPGARLMLIGNHNPQQHSKTAATHGVALNPDELICRSVQHQHVPAMLNAADLGVCFIVRTPSSLGVSATKVGEYLACGLPVIANSGIGDISNIITEGENGMILRTDTDSEISRCADRFQSGLSLDRSGIKSNAQTYFSIDSAVDSYDFIYRAQAS